MELFYIKAFFLFFIISSDSICNNLVDKSKPWVAVYHTALNDTHKTDQNHLQVSSTTKIPFSQLLFSWNGFRPKGYFSFYVQARNAHTKKWGSWHHMVDWGVDTQRSYLSKADAFSRYFYVRLEMLNNTRADAFRIKVGGCKGADFEQLKSLAVTVSNCDNFASEVWHPKLKNLSSVSLEGVPKLAQFALDHPDNDRICSPTSCTMMMRYVTKKNICPVAFANSAYDRGLDAYGSWPFNMAHAFEASAGSSWFFTTRAHSFTDVHKQLMRGLPVVVSVRGSIPGAPQAYPKGHLLVIVGFDAKTQEVICHDPAHDAHEKTLIRYPLRPFLHSWEASRRLTYWVEPLVSSAKLT